MSKNIKSFTLTEIIIVVVLIGILAAFSLPKYGKVFSKSDERNAIGHLMSIRTTVKFYLMNTSVAPIPDWADIDAINTALNINISDVNMTYQCWGTDSGDTNVCRATHTADSWVLAFHLNGPHNTDGSIHCTDTSCPSCPQGGAGDCG